MASEPRLLADIGGTNACFAWQHGPHLPLEFIQVLQCGDHAGLVEAVLYWLKENHLPRSKRASVAVASPVQSDHVQMTNNDWLFN